MPGFDPAKSPQRSEYAAGATAGPGSKDYALTTSVLTNTDQIEIPIIKVDTQAPTPALAAKLANSAVEGLSEYLDSKAAAEKVAAAERLRVKTFGAAQGTAASRGPGPLVALAATIFIFLGGCALIVISTALARAWRQESAAEQGEIGDLGGRLTTPRSAAYPATPISSSSYQRRRASEDAADSWPGFGDSDWDEPEPEPDPDDDAFPPEARAKSA